MRRIAFLLPLLLLWSCEEATTPTADDAAFDLPADQVMNHTTQNLTHEGIRRAFLEADSVLTFEQSRNYDLFRVKLTFYEDAGQLAGTLTADSAEYDVTNGLFIARGTVVLLTPTAEGERKLESEELFYDVPGDQLWSERPFVLTEDGQVTRGTSFRSDAQFQTWEVRGGQTEGSTSGGISF